MKLEDEIKTTFKDERFKAMINIKFTAKWMNNLQNRSLEQFGLSIPQYNILRILRGSQGDPLSVNSIRDRMVEKSPNTTRLMDKLIDKQFIERVRCDHDRRVVYVSITNDGLKLLQQMDDHFQNIDDFMSKITEEEANTLNVLLDKLREL